MTTQRMIPRVFGGTLILPATPPPPSPPPVIVTPAIPPQYLGGTIVPLYTVPANAYAVNGTVLDSQPTLCTAPISTAPIPAGTTLTLGFSNPSAMVQALFTNGATLSLTFALSDGSLRTAQVSIQIQTVGSMLLVSATLLQNSVAYVWVLPVQAP